MRCIEIAVGGFNMIDIYRLIETWDVLKLVNCNIYVVPCWINRNMRCIEIIIDRPFEEVLKGLIETWDVLKCWEISARASLIFRLIETWDVLKL